MKLMTNGTTKRYVPDSNVETYKAMGYVVEGEPAAQAPATSDTTPPVDGATPANDNNEDSGSEEDSDKDESEDEPEADNSAEGGKLVCPICGKKYAYQATLDRHIREKHNHE